MGIIPRLIVMMRNRRLAEISIADQKEQLAKRAALEKQREEDRMLAAFNDNSYRNPMGLSLSSLLRD